MDTKIFYMISIMLLGGLCGVSSMWLGERYYEKRFEKKGEKTIRSCMISGVLTALAGSAFACYGYMITDTIAFMGFVAGMLVIGRIDKLERIIPNAILAILIAIRSVLLLATIFIDSEYALKSIKNSVVGLLFWACMFGLIKLMYKDKIGMGDIKALVVAGFYLGIYRCSLVILIVLLVAIFSIVTRMITKKMKAKDYVSFGPYIAMGSYIALMLGI